MEKLDHKIFGPFVIKRKVDSRAYEIERPEIWDIYPVFHVSLLERHHENPVSRPQRIIPTPDIIDTKLSYVVAELVESRWYWKPKSKIPCRFVQ